MISIAVDGPAGAGKSTIAKNVAAKLGCVYVDTGALYRVLALNTIENNVDWENENVLEESLKEDLINIKYIDRVQHVYLKGEDVSEKIRQEKVGNMASKISAKKPVREKLLDLQRNIAKTNDVVMDGRDIGTVVLQDATLKIYLTASVEERANRRIIELKNKGQTVDAEKIKQDIINRDYQDMNREIAPLKQAEDAIYLDSSDMNIDEVTDFICNKLKEIVDWK